VSARSSGGNPKSKAGSNPIWSQRLRRKKLGPRFSEGARHLWLFLKEHQWPPEALALEIAKATGKTYNLSGLVNRWLYGDRKPSRLYANVLKKVAGILTDLWDQPSTDEKFVPPAAQKAPKRS
jgi:hypothetical protein